MKMKILLALVSTMILAVATIVMVVEGSRAYFELALTCDAIAFISFIVVLIVFNRKQYWTTIAEKAYWEIIIILRFFIILCLVNGIVILCMNVVNKELM